MKSEELKKNFVDYQLALQNCNKETLNDSLNKYFLNDLSEKLRGVDVLSKHVKKYVSFFKNRWRCNFENYFGFQYL